MQELYKRDLNWFFNQWIYKTGYPIYSYRWYREESNRALDYIILELRQVQFNGAAFTMPVEVTLSCTNGETTQTVLVNDLLEVFRFGIEKDFIVENITLDKNDKILKKISSEEFTAANYLNQNFPNPFNANTVIPLSITEGGYYELKIYNVQGSLIKTLARGVFGRGNYRYAWDGTNQEGEKVASGIYFYNLKGKTFSLSKKMLYLR